MLGAIVWGEVGKGEGRRPGAGGGKKGEWERAGGASAFLEGLEV